MPHTFFVGFLSGPLRLLAFLCYPETVALYVEHYPELGGCYHYSELVSKK